MIPAAWQTWLPRLVPLLFLVAAAALCPAQTNFTNTAFYPDIRSQLTPSQLADNETYRLDTPLTWGTGAHVPFESWKAIKSSALEIFLPGERQRALLQYAYKDSSLSYALEANIFTGRDQRWDPAGAYGLTSLGLRVNSIFNDNFRARAVFWNGKFSGDLASAANSPLIDGGNATVNTGSFVDNINGELSYSDEHFSAALGRGRFQIGNSLSGSVVLSDRVNEYDYALLEQRVGQFSFSFLHTTLRADTLVAGALPAKYAAIHQITWQPKAALDLYYGETVIYGNRLDLSYLVPANYWRVGKYGINDRDNLNLYGGVNFRPANDLTLYAMMLLDELTLRKLLSNWWGNKYAFQTGVSWNPPVIINKEKPRLGLEFTAVRPWTYTHYANVSMYSQENRPLGYAKGSNLLDATVELNFPLPWNSRWDSQFSCTWQGSRGNDWRLNYRDEFPSDIIDTAPAYWLEGDLSVTPVWQNTLRIGVMAHHVLLLGHRSQFGSAPSHALFGNWQFSF
ncbi:MAG: hypothetical protein LHW57_01330 [Candidatus Cloacimonetes bacterium]|nr:hypothetical protein [Candidatus Cloacimonadota bacterium]